MTKDDPRMARQRAYPSSPPVLDEEAILNGIKVEIIQELRADLVKSLNPERHFDFLRSRCVLSKRDCEEISHKIDRESKASVFLDKLLDHGPAAYERLCESLLREKTQLFLLKMLHTEYEKRRNNMEVLIGSEPVAKTQLPIAVDPITLPVPSQARAYQDT